ncbi:TRAP transporter permease [Thermosediminibacter litoriperuensis]|uniref:TRAP transporter 4TM/12TM fusion protein n=1 Tax=Thermosediminibacter litoriperuensis TaxID=291989 RepID=A0A5S5AK49_9FIRM|nr:TRAP transporter permease [Thermosediminibacter litoriperuensis]TYP49799.1 TRAP transporter 4TM/12TM fusion protein [Thermosediminibacter litoriperuensis]
MNINYKLIGLSKKMVFFAAVLVGIFHILNVSGFVSMSAMTVRAFHLMVMMFICFVTPAKDNRKNNIADTIIRIMLGIGTLFSGIYILKRWEIIVSSGGVTNKFDVLVGILMIFLVLEATRRSVGWMLSLITIIFLLYPFVGPYLPLIIRSRSYSVSRISTFLFTSTEGIFGIPISVSATYIILFCIYGAFLSEFGASEFLYNLASSVTRKVIAATAKTSIVFGALVGMISGSAAGNVAITGSLTIPMMIKEGYKPEKAGAIVAVAATGGQIMPPVMGAAAFIMAEIIGEPYVNIMKAAILPAILYFLSILIIVHLEAKKEKIDMHETRSKGIFIGEVVKKGWYFAIPILILIYMLVIGYSPFKSAYYSTLVLLGVYIVSHKAFSKEIVFKILSALEKGSKDTVSIAIACAASGIIVGILSITGLGSKISSMIITLSGGQPIIALILTMIFSLILGMGLPTTAAYLVLASVVVPALVQMGIPLLSAHMFVFFFGCISTITPPVALASYVAAGIAGTDLNKVGWTAFKYGLVSFVLPFMFVYGPSLLLNGEFSMIITTVVFSIVGVFAIACSIVGYFRGSLAIWQRILLFIAGVLLVNEGLVTDILGLFLIVCVYITNLNYKNISA